MIGKLLVALLLLAASPAPAVAQTVSDPRIVEFSPSPDHFRVVDNVPVVEGYLVQFYAVGTNVLLQNIDIGKPAPDADGAIRYDFAAALRPWQVANVAYEARVLAVGRSLTSAAATSSNSFTFTSVRSSPTAPGPACTYTLTPSSYTVTTIASTGTFLVVAADGCPWTAVSSAAWLTVTGGHQGVGNGAVAFGIARNSDLSERLATITVGPSTFTVSQSGGCTVTLTPTSHGFNPPGGTGSVTVTAPPGCSWTATRSGSWITITSGSSGSANGTVRYTVAANAGTTARVGTLTIAGRPVTITQSAGTAPNAPAGARVVIIR